MLAYYNSAYRFYNMVVSDYGEKSELYNLN